MSQLIEQFYTAFSKLEAEKMVSCYHPEVIFHDPAFGELKGERAKNMWRMLCHSQKDKDFKVTFKVLSSDDHYGQAHWEAFYTFSQSGRKVHNTISANFEFKEGLIIKHTDNFNLYRWSQQALGLKGYLFGFTSFFQNKLQQQTNRLLDKFENKQRQKSN